MERVLKLIDFFGSEEKKCNLEIDEKLHGVYIFQQDSVPYYNHNDVKSYPKVEVPVWIGCGDDS
ncbi:hypothetical protein TNCV_3749991 [Trichonephila clavipes]|nr:hypothetical protein TNCV_3749991 [Trichonephila clavipes]